MMSVLVEDPEGKAILLTKGAPEEVFHRWSHFELDGKLSPMDPNLIVGLKTGRPREGSPLGIRVSSQR